MIDLYASQRRELLDDQEKVEDLRERFYPDWWMFIGNNTVSSSVNSPSYIVHPRSEIERMQAYWVKPAGVMADIRPVEELK